MTAPTDIDVTKPHAARRYDYWLGGKDNFQADRDSGDAIANLFPTIRTAVLENRGFLRRAVEFVVNDGRVRQILDIGTGIPTSPNTHEIAQLTTPDTRVVYVDNDPIVLSHARALLTSSPDGSTAYIEADLRDPDRILADPVLRATIDFQQPVALMLVAVLHFLEDAAGPVEHLRRVLPSGSFLAITHIAQDLLPAHMKSDADKTGKRGGVPTFARTKQEFARLFEGLTLVEPGIVSVAEWRDKRPASERPSELDVAMWGAVGRVP
ncbi:SAM-dependent methyltransferase [Dactylosporangium siamense]|nr:SAM-dependent methyltransferase [Dactylosporangium siamense]